MFLSTFFGLPANSIFETPLASAFKLFFTVAAILEAPFASASKFLKAIPIAFTFDAPVTSIFPSVAFPSNVNLLAPFIFLLPLVGYFELKGQLANLFCSVIVGYRVYKVS